MLHDLKRLFRHGGIYLLGNILNRVGTFLLLPLYTKYLAVAEYGVLELLYATVAVISVLLSAGLSHTTIRFYFDYHEDRDRHAVVITNLVLVVFLGIVGAMAVHALRFPLSNILFDTTAYAGAIDLCLAIMVLEISTEVGFAYLRARELSTLYMALSFARLLLQVSLSIYLVAGHGMGIQGVLVANLASVALGWLVVVGYTLSRCGLTLRPSLVVPMLKYSLPMAFMGIVAAVVTNVDRFLLKEFLSLDAVGIYALSMKFALLLTFLVAEPFNRAYGPFRFSIIDQPSAQDIQRLVVHYLVAGAMFVALAIALFMPEALYFMAAPAYQSAYHYTPILLLAMVVMTVAYCFETGILYKKKTKYLLYVSLVNLVVKTILNVVLIWFLGIYGAAVAFLIAAIIQVTLINRFSQRLYPISYRYMNLFIFVALGGVIYLFSLGVDYRAYWLSVPYKFALVALYGVILYFTDADIRRLFTRGFSYLKFKGGHAPSHDN